MIDMQFRAQRGQYQRDFPAASFDVLLLNGEPVGNLTVDRSEAGLRLVDINLLPRFQRLGMGSLIIKRLISEGRSISLSVASDNRARSLYRSLGFEDHHESAVHVRMMLRQ
jgi:ribosomal protein S18 acetylase RimI-like enzyme